MRSATALVRALTLASRPFFDDPPDGFGDAPLAGPMPVLSTRGRTSGRRSMRWTPKSRRSRRSSGSMRAGVARALPAAEATTRVTGSPTATASGSIRMRCCKGNPAQLRSATAASCRTGARVAAIDRAGGQLARHHGGRRRFLRADPGQCRGRMGRPVARARRRRGRSGSSRSGGRSSRSTLRPEPTLDDLPFAKTVGDELYFAPESGRLFASPMDEVPSEPMRRPARRI